jgi:O-antigen/teichoic acid export membrane protein
MIYGFGILTAKALGFFMIPLYTHYLDPSDFGVLELLDLTSFMIGYFLGMGMGRALLRDYAHYEERSDKNEVISTGLIFTILVSGSAALILTQFRTVFSILLFGTAEYSFLVALLVVNLFLGLSLNLCKTKLRAEHRSMSFVTISLIYTGISLVLNIYFVAILQVGVRGVMYSTLITSSLMNVYLLLTTFRVTGFSFSYTKLSRMLRYGMPFIPTSVMLFLLNFSDRFFLKRYTDLHTVGLYGLGYKMGMIVTALVATPFYLIWSSYMFDVAKKKDARLIFARVSTYQILAMLTVALGLSILSREIIEVIADRAYMAAYTVIPLISLSMVLQSSNDVVQTGILVTRRTWVLPVIVGAAASVNIVLNILLIPRYSMMGAAVATVISYGAQVGFTYGATTKIYPIPFEIRRIAIAFCCGGAVYALASFITFESLGLRISLKMAALLLFPSVLLLVRFFREDELARVRSISIEISRLVGRRIGLRGSSGRQ